MFRSTPFRTLTVVVLVLLSLWLPHPAASDSPSPEGEASLPTPPPVTGTPGASPLYVHVQLPNGKFHVRALYFDSSCPQGTLCSERIYTADPFTGQASVPLVYGGPFVFYWWEHVRIEFPAWTPGAFFDASLDFPLLLYPETQPEDRITSYTVGYDPDVVRVLDRVCDIQAMSQQTIGFSRGSMEIRWSDSPSYSSNDYMNLPDLSYFDYWGPEQGPQLFDFTLAHEYYHGIQRAVHGRGGLCTPEENNFWDLFFADCASHDGCHTGQSLTGSFSEGSADAFGAFIKRKLRNEPLGPPWPRPCWEQFPSEPEMIGPERELNIDPYYYRLLVQDPLGAFNTFRYGRIAEVGGQTHPATTVTQFFSLWTDQDQEVNRWIAIHQPGNWDTGLYYRHFIYAQDVSAVETPPYPGFTEGERIRWIRWVSPNPATAFSHVRLRALVPSSRDVRISVYSVQGRFVTAERFGNLPEGEAEFSLHLPRLSSGVYLVHYEDARSHRVEDSAKLIMLH